MHIISYKKIRDFIDRYPESENSMNAWYKLVKSTDFFSFDNLKNLFPRADLVKNFTVFDVGGNKYRLIAFVNYRRKKVFIRYVLTHKEYDKDKWKGDQWFKNN